MDDRQPRGSLTIADRVGEKIAVRTALGVDGVIEHTTTLGALLSGSTPGRAVAGGDYPCATVDLSPVTPWVAMTIAVRWPTPVTEICRSVRAEVADELARLTGIRPDRVDVTVAAVVPTASIPDPAGDRPGFVELPPPIETIPERDEQEVPR
ncbi:Asp23/Gls24 family envelope stress response protein [Gordonia sp. NPDC003424]